MLTATLEKQGNKRDHYLDQQAVFYEWMDEYERMLRHMILGFEARPALQNELYQDIALNIWKALPSFEGKASPKTFIARIAQNVLASHVAKAVKTIKPAPIEDNTPEQIDSNTPYSELDLQQRQARLSAAIRELSFEYQQVITLALEGMSYSEMADILNVSGNLVGVRLKRAKQALSEALGQ